MKLSGISFTLLLIPAGTFAQQGVIVRQNVNSTFYYTSTFTGVDLQAAIDNCVNGDTLILPGGTFNITSSSSLIINKRLVIIGAGHMTASSTVTQRTVINSGLTNSGVYLSDNADGTSITGIAFNVAGSGAVRFENAGTQNVSFSRCDFGAVELGSVLAGSVNSQIRFQECLIGSLNGFSATSVSMDNCILKGGVYQGFFTGGLTMRNCVVHGLSNAGSGNYYYNCVFLRNGAGFPLVEQSCFTNCLFVCTSGTMSQGSSQCMTNCPTSTLPGVFNDVTSLTAYNLLFDYGIPGTSPAFPLNASIYLGPSPWKIGAVPFNPHWTGLTVPGITNGGLIQGVVIQGQAQSY